MNTKKRVVCACIACLILTLMLSSCILFGIMPFPIPDGGYQARVLSGSASEFALVHTPDYTPPRFRRTPAIFEYMEVD